jgi:hypothetical protein
MAYFLPGSSFISVSVLPRNRLRALCGRFKAFFLYVLRDSAVNSTIPVKIRTPQFAFCLRDMVMKRREAHPQPGLRLRAGYSECSPALSALASRFRFLIHY